MKRFIKRNLVLVIVLTVAAVATVVMMVYAIGSYIDMRAAIAKTNQMRNRIKELMTMNPAPSPENIRIINKDAADYKWRSEEIQRFFGQPLYPALDAFYSTLGLYDQAEKRWLDKAREDDPEAEINDYTRMEIRTAAVKDFYDYFKKFYEERRSDSLFNNTIFRAFRTSRQGVDLEYDDYPYYWDAAAWERAIGAFAETAKGLTLVPITNENREDIFFEALGVPRDFSGGAKEATKYLNDQQKLLVERLIANGIIVDAAAESFTFPDTQLSPKQTGHASRVMEIVSDLTARIAGPPKPVLEPGEELPEDFPMMIAELWDFDRYETDMEVTGYDLYRFHIKFIGNMDSLYALMQRLNDAASDRRIYIIRRMDIQAWVDEAHEIRYEAELHEEATESVVKKLPKLIQAPGRGTGGTLGPSTGIRPTTTQPRPTTAQPRPTQPGAMIGPGGLPYGQGSNVLSTEDRREPSRRGTRKSDQRSTTSGAMVGGRLTPGTGTVRPNPTPATGTPRPNMPGMFQGGGQYTAEQLAQWEEEQENRKPLEERKTYGVPVIGADIELEVDMIIDYMVLSNSDFEQE